MTGSISTQLTADSSPVSQSLVTLIATLSDAVPSLSSAIGIPNNALQNEFDSMKIIYDNASANLSRAEKNFIISKGGIEDYNKLTDINHQFVCNNPINIEHIKHPDDPKFNEYLNLLQIKMKGYIDTYC